MTGRELFITITAVAVCAIPATATAHGGNNDPHVVHACIGNITKVVRIVGANDKCVSTPPVIAETPAHWNIQGPQGPQGLQGVPGQQGSQGTPGTNGTDGINGSNGIDGASVTFGGYFTGSQNGCPNGGVIFTAGNPAVNAYVCNGANGIDGGDGGRPALPCFDNNKKYVDCGNGTVTDTDTGLVWLRDAACLGSADWAAANRTAAALAHGQCGLTDGSSAGDWRLPTRDEWSATVAAAVSLNCVGVFNNPPSLTGDAGGCLSSGDSSFLGVPRDPSNEFSNWLTYLFWSSTGDHSIFPTAWYMDLYYGRSAIVNKSAYSYRIWPVRGGSR